MDDYCNACLYNIKNYIVRAIFESWVIFFHQGCKQEAANYFRKTIDLLPKDPDAYNNLGNVCKEEKKYEEAILTLTKFIELNPDHESIPYAMYLKAYSYYERKPAVNFDQRTSEKAIDEFRALINKFPKSRYARKSIGHLNILKTNS